MLFPEAVWGVDCIASAEPNLPASPPVIWAYVTGTTRNPDIPWTAAQLARHPYSQVYTIDQGFGSQGAFDADEYDVEAGAWTVSAMVWVISLRNDVGWSTRVYCSWSDRASLLTSLAHAGVSAKRVYFRIADWNYSFETARAQIGGNVYAIQWASPSSNPNTVLPGTSLTLSQCDADLSIIRLGSTA